MGQGIESDGEAKKAVEKRRLHCELELTHLTADWTIESTLNLPMLSLAFAKINFDGTVNLGLYILFCSKAIHKYKYTHMIWRFRMLL